MQIGPITKLRRSGYMHTAVELAIEPYHLQLSASSIYNLQQEYADFC